MKEQEERYNISEISPILLNLHFYWNYVRDLGYEDNIRELLDKMKLKEFMEIHEENLLSILFYSW